MGILGDVIKVNNHCLVFSFLCRVTVSGHNVVNGKGRPGTSSMFVGLMATFCGTYIEDIETATRDPFLAFDLCSGTVMCWQGKFSLSARWCFARNLSGIVGRV